MDCSQFSCVFLTIGDFAVLLKAGMSVKMALVANFLSALSCFIGLFIGIEVGQQGEVRLWFFAIAGGIFLYVALVDMVWHSILSQFVIYTYWMNNKIKKLIRLNICEPYALIMFNSRIFSPRIIVRDICSDSLSISITIILTFQWIG